MKALVYHGPGQRSWDTVPDPAIIDPTDIVVRIDSSTICGTDLHILKGDVPATTPGTSSATKRSAPSQEVGAGVTTSPSATACCCRASAPAGAAASARRAATASASAAAAGSSAT